MVFVPKTDWANSPSTATPITAAELLRLEAGIVEGTQAASEALQGNVELASSAEMTSGNDLVRVPSVKRVADHVTSVVGTSVTAHNANTAAHPTLGSAISDLQTEMVNKVSLDVNGLIDIDWVPKSQNNDADTIAQRDSVGSLAVSDAVDANHAVSLSQAQFLFDPTTTGAVVRDLFGAGSLPVNAANNTTFVKIPAVRITDGRSADKWRCEYSIKYRASATGGISIQHSGNAVAETNLLPNPSFEINANGWTKESGFFTDPVSSTAGTPPAFDGSRNLLGVCTVATGDAYGHYVSDWIPATAGTDYSAALYCKLGAGTGKALRIDVQYLLADTTVSTTLGTPANGGSMVPTSTWTRIVNNAAPAAPATVTHVRVKFVYQAAVLNDSFRVDAVQLEPVGTVPPYGNQGGGADPLTFDGWWSGLTTVASPTINDYSRLETYRTAPGTSPCTFGGLGTTTDAQLTGSFVVDIGGTALQNQIIEFEFRQKALDGSNPTVIVAANATFVELP